MNAVVVRLAVMVLENEADATARLSAWMAEKIAKLENRK